MLYGEDGCVQLTIEDDGVGFDPTTVEQGGGQGIRNIHESGRKLGADLPDRICSKPGNKNIH